MAKTALNRRSFLRMAALSGAGAAFMATGTALADAPASPEDESAPEGAGAPPAGGFGQTHHRHCR